MPRIPGFGGNISPKTLFVVVIIPMFAVAFILRVIFSFVPPSRPNFLPPADGLIESQTVEEAQSHTEMTVVLPSDLLGSRVYAVGTYTRDAGTLPAGSVIVDTIKGAYRFVEISERPSTSLPDILNDFSPNSVLPVNLGKTVGQMLFLPSKHIACVSPNEKWNLPGYCEITMVLLFERDGIVFTIGADASHATEGEMITMAKDILAQ